MHPPLFRHKKCKVIKLYIYIYIYLCLQINLSKHNIMTRLKTTSFIYFLLLTFISCSNEFEEYTQIEKTNSTNVSRVQFSSQNTFLSTWTKLSEMTKLELNDWIDKNNLSLSNNQYKNPNINDDRDYFTALFDINNELQIGDSIIWYHNGEILLLSSNADENEVNINKSNPSKCFLLGKIEKTIITLDQDQIATTRGTLGSTGIDKATSHQREFMSSINTNAEFKFVYELVSYRNNLGVNTIYELVFANKLEWIGKGGNRNKWYEAREARKCTTKLNGGITAEIEGVGVSIKRPFGVSHNSTDELKYNSSLLLARTVESNGYHRFQRWTYNISCNMTQEILGDTNSRMSSSFNL